MRNTLLVAILFICLAIPVKAEQELSFGQIHAPLSASSMAVLKAAYAKINIHVSGQKLPAARALAQSAAGLTDGEVHRIKGIDKQYPQLVMVPVPINTVEGLAVSCMKTFDTSSPDAIRNYRIGIKIGTRYVENLTKDMPHIIRKADEDKLMEMLMDDRLDIVIGDRPWAEAEQLKKGRDCMVINEPPLVVIPLYHYLHERNKDLVPKIIDILREMEISGESQRIRARSWKDWNRKLQQ